jgi:hypothetical protein
VSFSVTDGSNPVAGATVIINSTNLVTNGSGTATIGLPNGMYPYTVAKAGYDNASGTVTITDNNIAEAVTLNETTYMVTFNVSDGTNPLPGATVMVNSQNLTTNISGVAMTSLKNGMYNDSITLAGYIPFNSSISVSGNPLIENVLLTKTAFIVTLNVADVYGPVANADVTLDGYGNKQTNAFGQVVFNNVAPSDSLFFSVSASGYNVYTDSVAVNKDVTESVLLVIPGIGEMTAGRMLLYPNPTGGIVNIEGLEGNEVIELLDITGMLINTFRVSATKQVLDLSDLSAGSYLIIIANNYKQEVVQVIVR